MAGAWSVGGSWGLALLMRQGLAAWMHAWPTPAVDGPADPATVAHAPPAETEPIACSDQLVTVLANMVFTARQEAVA